MKFHIVYCKLDRDKCNYYRSMVFLNEDSRNGDNYFDVYDLHCLFTLFESFNLKFF